MNITQSLELFNQNGATKMLTKYYIAIDYGYVTEQLLTCATTLNEAIRMAKKALQYEIFEEHIEVLTFANNHFGDGELEVHWTGSN